MQRIRNHMVLLHQQKLSYLLFLVVLMHTAHFSHHSALPSDLKYNGIVIVFHRVRTEQLANLSKFSPSSKWISSGKPNHVTQFSGKIYLATGKPLSLCGDNVPRLPHGDFHFQIHGMRPCNIRGNPLE